MCFGAISRCLKTFGGNNNKCLQRSSFCFTVGRFERSEKRPEVKQNGLQRGVDRGAVAPLEYQGGLGGGTPPRKEEVRKRQEKDAKLVEALTRQQRYYLERYFCGGVLG